MRARGEEVTETIEVPEIAFTGDTTIGFLDASHAPSQGQTITLRSHAKQPTAECSSPSSFSGPFQQNKVDKPHSPSAASPSFASSSSLPVSSSSLPVSTSITELTSASLSPPLTLMEAMEAATRAQTTTIDKEDHQLTNIDKLGKDLNSSHNPRERDGQGLSPTTEATAASPPPTPTPSSGPGIYFCYEQIVVRSVCVQISSQTSH